MRSSEELLSIYSMAHVETFKKLDGSIMNPTLAMMRTASEAGMEAIARTVREDTLQECKLAVAQTTLPAGYQWGEDATRAFEFGKERSVLAIYALQCEPLPVLTDEEVKALAKELNTTGRGLIDQEAALHFYKVLREWKK